MDMERLSKSQIVLLTLLVSFVTSIATGIVTVSLMDQAPPAFAQTVNRIVERTVEKVVASGQTASSVVTQEKTIIVKESELISKAVHHIESSVVRLYSSAPENPIFIGLGLVADGSGTIIGDIEALGEGVSAVAELSDESRVRIFVSSNDVSSGLVYFISATTTFDGKPIKWTPVSIAVRQPALGETVVMLAGKTVSRIAAGLVTTLTAGPDASSPQIIETDIASEAMLPGSPLFDTDGSLLGIRTALARAISSTGFTSASVLLKKDDEKPE